MSLCAFSLREVVHDDNVQPKMQTLMMDSSFSMVTVQGEDSGIAWETTPSRCTTPWASEAGSLSMELSSPVLVRPTTPGSAPAGKIIFVMDEELISRHRKTKERMKSKDRQRVLAESLENVSGRPELVGVSQPNVKNEEGDEEEPNDALVDKDKRLFSLVSEGSEILNIIVPPKLATVDEEESKEMVDNLSYLEDSPVPKASEETNDHEPGQQTTAAAEAVIGDRVKPPPLNIMDPPGAPVPRPSPRAVASNMDYFEALTLMDTQAPGSPDVSTLGLVEQEAEVSTLNQDSEKPLLSQDNTPTTAAAEADTADAASLEEITSELLDEVFYGSTDDSQKNLDRGDRGSESVPVRLPSKPSGSNLFGSQEEILTPIYLPEGPPKIIDPILLEEPKAMAFLYTDLYEEATGSRQKEEDTESLSSEKSFHSRHSDREARGYLEKYALIDETPVVEVEPSVKSKDKEDVPRILSEDLYDFGISLSKPGKDDIPHSEEEITDFLRSSGNNSPCDIDPFPQSIQEEEPQVPARRKGKAAKQVTIEATKVPENPTDQLSSEFPAGEPDWEGTDDHPVSLDDKQEPTDQEMWEQQAKKLVAQKPVPPPRKKVASPPKACLDLTPLTPVDVITQVEDEAGGKEQRVEEKETASPAETADEGDGDGEEATQNPCGAAPSESILAAVESQHTDSEKDSIQITAEESDTKTVEVEQTNETKDETQQTESEQADSLAPELAETAVNPEKEGDTLTASPAEPAKGKAQCIIL